MRRRDFLGLLGLTGCCEIEEDMTMFRNLMMSGLPLVPDDYPELGLAYLQANARFFYDLTELTGANGASISNGNTGLNDLSSNNLDAVIVGVPIVKDLALRYGTTIKTLQDNSTNCISINNNGATIFNSSFTLWFVYQTTDGNPAAVNHIIGGVIPTNLGLQVNYQGSGTWRMLYGNASGVVQWRTRSGGVDTPIFQNAVAGLCLIRIDFNFEDNSIDFYLNGRQVTTEEVSGTISTIDPTATWNNTRNIYIGSMNNNGTTETNPNISSIVAAACTPIPSDTEALYVSSYLYQKCFKWEDELTITSSADITTLRTSLVASVFNGAGLPSVSPVVLTGYTGAMHICNSSNLTGFSSINRLRFTMNDVDGYAWQNAGFIIFSSAPNGKLVINSQGHQSDSSTAHETWMNQLLAAGYDVLFVGLPISSNDNTEQNPTITLLSTSGHNQILTGGLDRVGYNPLELYFFDKTSAITYLQNLYSYSAIYCCGISGGGWMVAVLSAMDTRITRSVCVRGSVPKSFWDNSAFMPEGDYEQGGTMFTTTNCGSRIAQLYNDHSMMDLYLMCGSVGRRFKMTNHIIDECCFCTSAYSSFAPRLINKALTLGGKFEQTTDTDPSTATHAYSLFDRTAMINFFNAS